MSERHADAYDDYCYGALAEAYEKLKAENAELKRLLSIALCPDDDCVGGGIPHQYLGEHDVEVDWTRCQFCDERDKALGDTNGTPESSESD